MRVPSATHSDYPSYLEPAALNLYARFPPLGESICTLASVYSRPLTQWFCQVPVRYRYLI